MKVRIKQTPFERELDGLRLDNLRRGMVKDVAAPLGAWLLAQGYADAEMRRTDAEEELGFSGIKDVRHVAEHHHRRRTDLCRRSTDH